MASIEAWDANKLARTMLRAGDWERVEVHYPRDKAELVIHYKGGHTAAFALRSAGPNDPTFWRANAFAVSTNTLPEGDVCLSMHFCYRGCVQLTLQRKQSSPDRDP